MDGMQSRTSEKLSFALFRSTPRFAPGGAARGFLRLFGGGQFAALLCRPARFVDLAAAGDSQSIGGDIFRDGRTCGDVRAITDAHGRDQGGIAADENFAADRGRILVEAVVIAGNRARADVALGSDLRIAQVRKVHRLGTFADRAFLEFDEIADAGPGFQVIVRAQAGERSDDDAVIEATLRYHAMRLDGYVVAKDSVGQYAARSNDAARADFGPAQQLHAGFDYCVLACSHVRINEHGLGQLNGDAVIHQRVAFPLPEYAVHFGKIRARVAAEHFAGIGGYLRQHGFALGV